MDEALATIVERELGTLPTSVEALQEGLMHETHLVECAAGEFVLQVADQRDHERLRNGLHWYRELAATPVPVPAVVTETVRAFDGRYYTVVERLPGTSGERDVTPERVRNAGRALAAIHDARSFEAPGEFRYGEHGDGDGGPTVEPFEEGSLKAWLLRLAGDAAAALRAGGLDEPAAAVERLVPRLREALPERVEPVLCHADFSADNVLFEGDAVTGVVDFDIARALHDQLDLAHAANGFWMHDPAAEWDVRATFYQGYRESRSLSPSFERLEPPYRAQTLAGSVASMLESGHLSADERAFYAEAVVEAVERALSAN